MAGRFATIGVSFAVMAKRDMETGPAGKAVVVNMARLRKERGLNLNQLSERTEKAGRKLSVSALSLIATGKRRVDVDDLVALAEALGVSSAALLGDSPASTADLVAVVSDLAGRVDELKVAVEAGAADTKVNVGLAAAGEVGHGND